MIFEDDTFKDFIYQTHETESTLDDIPLTPRSDRRREKPFQSKKNLSAYSSYAAFSCDEPKATYISRPSQIFPIENHSAPYKTVDWNHLRVFYYVAQCRSFTKAVDILKVSQPALSRTMKQLENRLQEKLFHRNRQTRQLTLTRVGAKTLDIITPSVLQLESLMQRLQE